MFTPMEKPDRKAEILSVAAKLFRERGYSAVSMRDLAQALDIKAASLYNHITSKQEILVLIVIKMAEEFTRGMNDIAQTQTSAVEKLTRIIALHIDLTLSDPDSIACLNNDWMHLSNQDRSYFLEMRDDYDDNLRQIVQTGIANQEIRNLNVEVILFSMLSTLRTLYLWHGRKKTLNTAALKENITHVLLHGIV